jgi:hypothetical protein
MKNKVFPLSEIIKACGLEKVAGKNITDRPVAGGYASDLLSDVMANAKNGDIWITLQTHPNIVAVAVLKEISAIVIINGRKPEPEMLEKAAKEGIPVLVSPLPAFELIGKLYGLGVSGLR